MSQESANAFAGKESKFETSALAPEAARTLVLLREVQEARRRLATGHRNDYEVNFSDVRVKEAELKKLMNLAHEQAVADNRRFDAEVGDASALAREAAEAGYSLEAMTIVRRLRGARAAMLVAPIDDLPSLIKEAQALHDELRGIDMENISV